MPATVYFRNSKIVVPVEELATTLQQLAIAEATLGMQAQRPADAADVQRQLDMLTAIPVPRSDTAVALDFLSLIRDYRISGGAPQAEVMRVLGAAHPKGIGSKAAVLNRVISNAGLKVEHVYSSARDSAGLRSWKAEEQLLDAIECLSTGRRYRAKLNEPEADKRESLDE